MMGIITFRLDPRAKPLFKRLAKLSSWPSLGWTLIIAVCLIVASLGFWAWYAPIIDSAYVSNPQLAPIPIYLSLAILINMIAMPAAMGSFAARLAGQDARSENFVLLGLTQLTGRAVFQGYFIAALFRRRLMLALSLGLSAFVIGAYITITDSNMRSIYALNLSGYYHLRWLGLTVICIGAWGMILLSMAGGIDLALRMRSNETAPVIVTVTVGLGMLFYGFIAWQAQNTLFSPFGFEFHQPLIPAVTIVLLGVLPFALTAWSFTHERPALERQMWQTTRPEQW